MALVIRECEFTMDHRPVSLRILLAACRTCPDPETPEPIMHPDPETAEIIHAASLQALGRLRYYAENDGQLEQIITDFDHAVADALGVGMDAVAALTSTTPTPNEDDAEFDKLKKDSSLSLLAQPGERAHEQQELARMTIIVALSHIHHADHNRAVDSLARLPKPVTSRIRPLLAELLNVLTAAEQRRDTQS